MDDILIGLWKKLPPPLRNRYFLASVLFVAFMVFVDRHDVLTQIRLQRMVNRLEDDRGFYEEKIKTAEAERLDMQINKERFAREQYFMQRNNEDVFIITEEDGEETN
ncbi:MAG: hypothetical protein R2795_25475 [Saprospiraceae bacterium]